MLSRREAADSAGYGGLSPRRQSTQSDLFGETVARRLSEAGVNRRPSAAQILTTDTDSFEVGQSVYVDGVKPGRIQYIGETKFGPGDWAGVVLDERLGKNDGSVGRVRYFQCEPGHGVFSRLFRLTTEPIEGASEVLSQMKRYGYELLDSPVGRRGSTGSGGGGGSRRGSTSLDDRRASTDRGSMSPRSATPELRRYSLNRSSPDSHGAAAAAAAAGGRRTSGGVAVEPRRASLTVPERRGSAGSPTGRRTPGRSPLASPGQARSQITGGDVKIEKDPNMTRLAQEARRLSMGTAGAKTPARGSSPPKDPAGKKSSFSRGPGSGGGIPSVRNGTHHHKAQAHEASRHRTHDNGHHHPGGGVRRPSEATPSNGGGGGGGGGGLLGNKRTSVSGVVTRKVSDGFDSTRCELHRRASGDLEAGELEMRRRRSEAGLRRESLAGAGDAVLNDDTGSLMVGQQVWVDGTKHGRIAYLGTVHFARGQMAGVHLEGPAGKNNGTVGGVMYFQCEPRHGIFARLHRLALQPIIAEETGSN